MKKLISVLAVILLLASLAFSASAEDGIISHYEYYDDNFEPLYFEKKVYVLIHPDWYEKEYTTEDFSDIGCVKVSYEYDRQVEGGLAKVLLLSFDKEGKQAVLDAISILEMRDDVYSAQPAYNPATGDTIEIPVLLLMFSGAALMMLVVCKRKYSV